jgi:copper chaperone CopZ
MYELKVEGMRCGHCVGRVTKSIHEIDANAEVDVDLQGRTVRVTTNAAMDAVASALAEAGYPVTASSAV